MANILIPFKVGRFACKFRQLLSCLFFCFALSEPSPAYVLEGAKWQYSPVNVQMNLTATAGSLQYHPSFPLMDGSTSWEQVYTGAASVWNAVMGNLQLTTTTSPGTTNLGTQDGINEAFFGTSYRRIQPATERSRHHRDLLRGFDHGGSRHGLQEYRFHGTPIRGHS